MALSHSALPPSPSASADSVPLPVLPPSVATLTSWQAHLSLTLPAVVPRECRRKHRCEPGAADGRRQRCIDPIAAGGGESRARERERERERERGALCSCFLVERDCSAVRDPHVPCLGLGQLQTRIFTKVLINKLHYMRAEYAGMTKLVNF